MENFIYVHCYFNSDAKCYFENILFLPKQKEKTLISVFVSIFSEHAYLYSSNSNNNNCGFAIKKQNAKIYV